jgi:tetratricopeptide (TPR) repeat protein
MSETHWLPGILALSAGLVAAALYLLLGRRRSVVAPSEAEGDAQRRVDSLLNQLREHQSERHQMEAAAWTAEQERLEKLAAEALRARESASAGSAGPSAAGGRRSSAAETRGSGLLARHPQLSGALWGGGLVLFFGALGLWLSQEQRSRGAGEVATGTAGRADRGSPANPPPASDEAADREFQAALGRVRDEPGDNLEMTGEVVRELIRRSDFQQAFDLNERALSVDPFRTESRVHRAFLKAVLGEREAGLRELARLARLYPHGSEALLFSGMIRMQGQEQRQALEDFEGYLAATPANEVPPQLREGVGALRQRLTGAR